MTYGAAERVFTDAIFPGNAPAFSRPQCGQVQRLTVARHDSVHSLNWSVTAPRQCGQEVFRDSVAGGTREILRAVDRRPGAGDHRHYRSSSGR
jgi:hypothetical protein